MTSSLPKALGHIRVLDLSRVLAGPWCSQNLADLGADVIKIERPGNGDDTRAWGPPYAKDAEGNDTTEAAYYLCANRGKRSVTVDIATEQGRALIQELARHADVVLENYKVGQLARYGLDYASLKAIKSDLVYCSITGFGQDGPYAHRAGYDFLIQGMGGLMSVTGERDDLPGGGPQKAGVAAGLCSVMRCPWSSRLRRGRSSQRIDKAHQLGQFAGATGAQAVRLGVGVQLRGQGRERRQQVFEAGPQRREVIGGANKEEFFAQLR